jgi:hypothetical protein
VQGKEFGGMTMSLTNSLAEDVTRDVGGYAEAANLFAADYEDQPDPGHRNRG